MVETTFTWFKKKELRKKPSNSRNLTLFRFPKNCRPNHIWQTHDRYFIYYAFALFKISRNFSALIRLIGGKGNSLRNEKCLSFVTK